MKKLSEKVVSIHGEFVRYGRNAREWMRKCEMLLPHVERERVWEKKGFSSIYHYAAVLAGMSRPKIDEALRVIKRIEDMPELMKVAENKGIQAVRPVATIATAETESFWAQKAEIMSKHTLETYVKEWKSGYEATNIGVSAQQKILPGEEMKTRKVVGMELEMEVVNELEKLKGKEDWNTLMKELLEMRRAKLEAEKPEAVKVVSPGKAKRGKSYHSRPAPAKIQKFVKAKTNGQCVFPGCNKPHEILHHTERFSLTNEHDPDTIVPLCREHERLAHLGLIENEEKEPRFWRVRECPEKHDVKWQVDEKVQKYRAQKLCS